MLCQRSVFVTKLEEVFLQFTTSWHRFLCNIAVFSSNIVTSSGESVTSKPSRGPRDVAVTSSCHDAGTGERCNAQPRHLLAKIKWGGCGRPLRDYISPFAAVSTSLTFLFCPIPFYIHKFREVYRLSISKYPVVSLLPFFIFLPFMNSVKLVIPLHSIS